MNVAALAALWFAYAAVRNLSGDTQHAALDNASRLLDLESVLGIDIEGALQSTIDWPQAFVAANSYYLLHFPLTMSVLVFAFWRHRMTVFPVVRNSLIGCSAVALVVHLAIPMAPPRMLPGFVDAGASFGPDPYAIAGSESANQFAAMPSMHVAWSILCGYAIWRVSAHRVARIFGIVHPVVTSLVVIVTGHHFVSDVAIGAALALLFLAVAITLQPRLTSVCRRHPDAPPNAIDHAAQTASVHSRHPRSIARVKSGLPARSTVLRTQVPRRSHLRRSGDHVFGGRRDRPDPSPSNRHRQQPR